MAELQRAAPPSGSELLRLARRDRAAGRRALAQLEPEAQARACAQLNPAVRSEFLMLCDSPEQVVPHLPEAELVHAIRATGMSEGGWLLELATPEQRAACFDLDCWQADALQLERVGEWLDALIEAGSDTLAQVLVESDPELWALVIGAQVELAIVGKEDDPPDGAFTLDGVVYVRVPEPTADDVEAGVSSGDAEADADGQDDGDAEGEDDEGRHVHGSPERVRAVLAALYEHAQPLYWQLIYGILFETRVELEEYALRWRSRRLQDLGFPEREQAMRVYRPLPPEHVEVYREPGQTGALAPATELPRQLRGTLLADALLALGEARAGELLGYVLGVANAIAVADRLPLADPESVPRALEKAVRGIDAGLRELARVRGEEPARVLDTTLPLDLFRAGATVQPELRGPYRG